MGTLSPALTIFGIRVFPCSSLVLRDIRVTRYYRGLKPRSALGNNSARRFILATCFFPQGRAHLQPVESCWAMLNDAISHVPPVRGTPEEMLQILEHRRNLVNGFGLPVKTKELPDSSLETR